MNFKSRDVIRLVSAILVLTFTCQDLLWAAPELKPGVGSSELRATVFPPASDFRPPSFSWRIPSEWGKLGPVYNSGADKTLILIQDAHTNFGAQKNISNILEDLFTSHHIRTVFVEGGTRDDSLNFLRPLAPKSIREQVARKYLLDGEIDGPEYLSLAGDHDFKLLGVEDGALYGQNLTAYAAVAGKREALVSYLDTIHQRVDSLKRQFYTAPLYELSDFLEKFKNKEKEFGEYFTTVSQVSRESGVNLLGYPQFLSLEKLKSLEAGIDFKKANEELAIIADRLPGSFPRKRESSEPSNGSGKSSSPNSLIGDQPYPRLREGDLPHTGIPFYEEVLNLAKDHKLDAENLSRYVAYLKFCEKLDWESLAKELEKLEDDIFQHALTDPKAVYLYQISKHVQILKKLFTLSATREIFDEYEASQLDRRFHPLSWLAFLNRELMDLGQDAQVVDYRAALEETKKPLQEFYRLTQQRDEMMVQKAIRQMDQNHIQSAVLVTGGYHTKNLTRLLKENRISYLVVSPHVDTETNLKKYEKILLSQQKRKPAVSDERTLPKNLAPGAAVEARPLMVQEIGARLSDLTRTEREVRTREFEVRNDESTATFGARLARMDANKVSGTDSSIAGKIRKSIQKVINILHNRKSQPISDAAILVDFINLSEYREKDQKVVLNREQEYLMRIIEKLLLREEGLKRISQTKKFVVKNLANTVLSRVFLVELGKKKYVIKRSEGSFSNKYIENQWNILQQLNSDRNNLNIAQPVIKGSEVITHFQNHSENISYIVTNYFEGRDLSQRVRTWGSFNDQQVLDFGLKLAKLVSFAHKKKIIIRELKPENIMIRDDETIALYDFNVSMMPDYDWNKDPYDFKRTIRHGYSDDGWEYFTHPQDRNKPDMMSDIFTIGMDLFFASTGEEYNQERYGKKIGLEKIKNGFLREIIGRAIASREIRYKNTDELIADLEKLKSLNSPLYKFGARLSELAGTKREEVRSWEFEVRSTAPAASLGSRLSAASTKTGGELPRLDKIQALLGFEAYWTLSNGQKVKVRIGTPKDLARVMWIQEKSPADEELRLKDIEVKELLKKKQVLVAEGMVEEKIQIIGAIFTHVSDGQTKYADVKDPNTNFRIRHGAVFYDFWIVNPTKVKSIKEAFPGLPYVLIFSSAKKAGKRKVVAFSRPGGVKEFYEETLWKNDKKPLTDEQVINYLNVLKMDPDYTLKLLLRYLLHVFPVGEDPHRGGSPIPFLNWLNQRYGITPESDLIFSKKLKELLNPKAREEGLWKPSADDEFQKLIGLLLRQLADETGILPVDATLGWALHMKYGATFEKFLILSRPDDSKAFWANGLMSYTRPKDLAGDIERGLKDQERQNPEMIVGARLASEIKEDVDSSGRLIGATLSLPDGSTLRADRIDSQQEPSGTFTFRLFRNGLRVDQAENIMGADIPGFQWGERDSRGITSGSLNIMSLYIVENEQDHKIGKALLNWLRIRALRRGLLFGNTSTQNPVIAHLILNLLEEKDLLIINLDSPTNEHIPIGEFKHVVKTALEKKMSLPYKIRILGRPRVDMDIEKSGARLTAKSMGGIIEGKKEDLRKADHKGRFIFMGVRYSLGVWAAGMQVTLVPRSSSSSETRFDVLIQGDKFAELDTKSGFFKVLFHSRKADKAGRFKFRKTRYSLTAWFANEKILIKPKRAGQMMDVQALGEKVAILDPARGRINLLVRIRKADGKGRFVMQNVRYATGQMHAGKTLFLIPADASRWENGFRVLIDGRRVDFRKESAGSSSPAQSRKKDGKEANPPGSRLAAKSASGVVEGKKEFLFGDWVPGIERSKLESAVLEYVKRKQVGLGKGLAIEFDYESGMPTDDLSELRDGTKFFRYQYEGKTRYFFRDAGSAAVFEINAMLHDLEAVGIHFVPLPIKNKKRQQETFESLIGKHDKLMKRLYARAQVKEANEQIYSVQIKVQDRDETMPVRVRINKDGSVDILEETEWVPYLAAEADTDAAKEIRAQWHIIASRIGVMKKYQAYLETLNGLLKSVNNIHSLEQNAIDEKLMGIVEGLKKSLRADSDQVAAVIEPLAGAIRHTSPKPMKNVTSIEQRNGIIEHLNLALDQMRGSDGPVSSDEFRTHLLGATGGFHEEIQRLHGIIVGSAATAIRLEKERTKESGARLAAEKDSVQRPATSGQETKSSGRLGKDNGLQTTDLGLGKLDRGEEIKLFGSRLSMALSIKDTVGKVYPILIRAADAIVLFSFTPDAWAATIHGAVISSFGPNSSNAKAAQRLVPAMRDGVSSAANGVSAEKTKFLAVTSAIPNDLLQGTHIKNIEIPVSVMSREKAELFLQMLSGMHRASYGKKSRFYLVVNPEQVLMWQDLLKSYGEFIFLGEVPLKEAKGVTVRLISTENEIILQQDGSIQLPLGEGEWVGQAPIYLAIAAGDLLAPLGKFDPLKLKTDDIPQVFEDGYNALSTQRAGRETIKEITTGAATWNIFVQYQVKPVLEKFIENARVLANLRRYFQTAA